MRRLLCCFLLSAFCVAAATREPVHSRRAMVVSAEPNATRIGADILRNGGNAVDAAVAVGLALAVTHPPAGNLGGGGFLLLRFADGGSAFIDFREKAPAAARRAMYLGPDGEPTDESVVGYRAAGVPGTVRGLALALEKYGTRPWKELIRPAQQLAERGFTIPYGLAASLRRNSRLPQFPDAERIFLNAGRFFEQGDLLKQIDLAETLERLAEHGPDEFYEGKTARLIAADMRRRGGLITLEDLRAYRPSERQALEGSYHGYGVLSAPPSSSGGAGVLQMLAMLEDSDYAEAGPGSAAAIHHVTEVMRRFFADRAEYFGDADFVEVPLKRLLSEDYIRQRRASIRPDRVTPSADIGPGLGALARESTETTHFSIVDEDGNAVSLTYTLNGSFGSGATALGTGVLLNNEMDDFTAKPGEPNQFGLLQSANNAIEPGKRPISAMTPTIVTKDDELFLVLGAPGGPTIITTVLQTILNVIDFEMNIQQAIDFPRFHHQWMPDKLRIENYGFSPDTIDLLRQRGHELERREPWGRAMAILVAEDGLEGAADARSEGLAAGY